MRDNLNGIQSSKGFTYCVLGDLYTFRAIGKDTGEAYALFELMVQPHNSSLLHAHSLEDKAFYILDGEVEFQIEEQTFVAISGTFLHCSKGQPHRFTNIGATPAKMLCWVIPAGLEDFFAEVGQLTEHLSSELSALSPTDMEKFLAIAPDYGLEIIPSPSDFCNQP